MNVGPRTRITVRSAILALVAPFFLVLTAAPSSAADIGRACWGVKAPRCGYMFFDPNYGYGAEADIDDRASLQVSVNSLSVQAEFFAIGWRDVARLGDYDGWHDSGDRAQLPGGSFAPQCGFWYRWRAYFQWRGSETGGEWRTGPRVKFC